MKIKDVKTVLLTGPCTEDPFLLACRKRRSAAFVEIYTDSDLIGLGETYGGYFCPELIPAVVEAFKPLLIDQEVDNISDLWDRMYYCENFWCRVGLGPIVLTGIEAALWDLKGKMENLPVCELLGGRKHDLLPAYATGGPSNYPKSILANKLDFYMSLGFKGIKIGAGWFATDRFTQPSSTEEIAALEGEKLQFVRSHVGDNMDIMLDAHMSNSPNAPWSLETALAVSKAIAPQNVLFLEEPLHYTDPWGYAELCRNSPVPIAGGECLTTVHEWKIFSKLGCFNIGQPDASFVGGLNEFTKVADLFEVEGRKIATHSWGAGGSFMQNVHAGFACSNTMLLEIAPAFGPLHYEIMGDAFEMEDGFVLPPEAPGLGIELTEEIKNRYPFVPGSGEFNDVPGRVLTD